MFNRLARKIAQRYMKAQQPLRLQPDYGERNAADFLGDRNVARNTGYGENLKPGPGNAFDEVVAESFSDFLGEDEQEILSDLEAGMTLLQTGRGAEEAEEVESFEIIDDLDDDEIIDDLGKMAEFWKESRLPSRKHHSDEVVDKAVEQWREDNPEVAKKFDAEKVDSKEEMMEKLKLADEIIDDIGLDRMASSHSSLIRKVEKALRGTPLSVELDSDYDGTDLLIQWGRWDVYDLDDYEGYEEDELEEETKGMIEREELSKLLSEVYDLVERNHKGFVESGTSDISEGVYRIRIDHPDYRMASDRTAAKLLKRHIKVLEKNLDRLKGIMFYDDIPQDIIRDLERVKWTETLHMDVERWLGDHAFQGGRNRWAKDHEQSGSYMSRQNLREMSDMADFIVDDIGMEGLDDWVEDKISQSYAALNDVARYRGYRDDHPHGEDSDSSGFKFAEDEIIDDLDLSNSSLEEDDIIDDLDL